MFIRLVKLKGNLIKRKFLYFPNTLLKDLNDSEVRLQDAFMIHDYSSEVYMDRNRLNPHKNNYSRTLLKRA